MDVPGNRDVNGDEMKVSVPGAETDDDEAPIFFVPADSEDEYYRGWEKAKKQVGNCNGEENGRNKRNRTNGVAR